MKIRKTLSEKVVNRANAQKSPGPGGLHESGDGKLRRRKGSAIHDWAGADSAVKLGWKCQELVVRSSTANSEQETPRYGRSPKIKPSTKLSTLSLF